MTFILSVTPFLGLMSYFFSFFIPPECGIALCWTVLCTLLCPGVWSAPCSFCCHLPNSLVASCHRKLEEDKQLAYTHCSHGRKQAQTKCFPFPSFSHFLAKSAGMWDEVCPPCSHLQHCCWVGEGPLRGVCLSSVVGKWGFLKWPFEFQFSSMGWGIRQHWESILKHGLRSYRSVFTWEMGLCLWDSIHSTSALRQCSPVKMLASPCKVQIWDPFAISGGKLALLNQRISPYSSFLRLDFNSISVPCLEKKVLFPLKQLTFSLSNDFCHPSPECLSP